MATFHRFEYFWLLISWALWENKNRSMRYALETVELPTGRYKSRFDLKANNFLTQALGVHAGKHFPRNKVILKLTRMASAQCEPWSLYYPNADSRFR